MFGGVLCTISGDNDCPLSATLQWLPEMLLVSLLPHYNPLCVLCEWLMMIMQMFHRRAAWVIITAENEAFWNSPTAEEKTMGLQCAWECVFISLGELRALRSWPWWCLPNLLRVLWCLRIVSFLSCVVPLHLDRKWNCCKVVYFIPQTHFYPAVSSRGYIRACCTSCPSLISWSVCMIWYEK